MNRAFPATSRNAPYLLAAYAITLPSVLIAGFAAPSSDLVAALKLACIAAFAWHAAGVLANGPTRGSALALAAATGLLWSALAAMYVYEVVAMAPLDFSMIAISIHEARATLVHVLGEHALLMTAAALAGCTLAASGAAWIAFRQLRALAARVPHGPRTAVACVGLLCYFAAADFWYATEALVLYPRVYSVESPGLPALLSLPDYSGLPIRSKEAVFVVQLESVNALAVFDPAADGPAAQRKVSQPGLEAIVKEGRGVLFPLFWANGTRTHRAWESILCGVSGNLGPALSAEPARLGRTPCLPGHLAAGGYESLWLYSYFNLEFFNLAEFAHRAGFRDVVYGPRVMLEEDPRHQWGYDDCAFYDRAFDYLARQGLDKRERLFAYFEVGMHHAPFLNSRKHPQAHPFPNPASMLEHYLNSNAEQDHCLLVFWRRFRQLGRDDVHLFIVPDHSLWVPGVPVHPDGAFATWLVYVPPARRAGEFTSRTVLSPTPSQAQLYPTILELLEGAALPGSFAFALRGEAPPAAYQDCQLLTDSSDRLVVRKGAQRAEFRVRGGSVVVPGSAVKPDFWGFRERFACS